MSLRSASDTLSSESSGVTAAAEPSRAPQARVCPSCSSPLAADQEWCLECGAATTLIRTAPDWRIGVVIVVVVIAVALTGFIIALSRV